jgi:hypothetical protein
MKTTRGVFSFCLLGMVACVAHAEKVNMTPARLQKTATHVIVGTVTKISTSKTTDAEWETTSYVADVRIKTLEKGEGIKVGDLVQVRYWHRTWIGPKGPRFDTNGHRGLPQAGETLRIYLAQNAYDGFGTTNDGGFNVIGANGFEKLKE